MKILLISNMYPSTKDPTYGTFVKMFKDGVEKADSSIKIKKVVIDHRIKGCIKRLITYIPFYINVFINALFGLYDLVYLHQGTHSSPPLMLARIFRKFKLVINFHGSDVVTIAKLDEILFNLSKPLYRQATRIVVPSSFFMAVVKQRLPELTDDIFFISPSGGVSKEVFPFKVKPNIASTIICVSRIDYGKGWDTLLDALAIVVASIPNIKCRFIGTGTQVLQFKRKIETLGLKNNCTYHGAMSHSQLCNEFHNADLSIFPTQLEESLGLVGIEAQSCGCPVIGSRIGCLPEFIHDGWNGFLVDPGNAKELAVAIIRYYSLTKEQRETMNKNAQSMASNYEATRVADNMCDMLKLLID